jgi:ribosomal protein S6
MLRKYRITVIFDIREQAESPDDMRLRLCGVIGTLGATVDSEKSLGIREFSRCACKQFRSGAYAQYCVTAQHSFSGEFSNKMRLDKTVNRVLIERL